MSANQYADIFKQGYNKGKKEGFIEAQELNKNNNLPSTETLYEIFRLLFECMDLDEKTSSCYLNPYKHYADYIVTKWNK